MGHLCGKKYEQITCYFGARDFRGRFIFALVAVNQTPNLQSNKHIHYQKCSMCRSFKKQNQTKQKEEEGKNTLQSPDSYSPLPSWFVDDANWHLALIPHLLGSHGSNWSSSMQMSQMLHFQVILQIYLTWPLTLVYDLWPHEHTKGLI